jgi:hypothetical protein
MNDVDLLFWALLGSGGLLVVLAIVGPPLQYLFESLASGLDDLVSGYYGHWLFRLSNASYGRHQRRARRAFKRWFARRFDNTPGGGVSDDELVAAQQLMPVIRQLLEEEVPTTIRRCNHVHRRMAILLQATHMREIAAEPECLNLRHFTALLLEQTVSVLDQYPLSLRLDTEELLDATLVVRRSLYPTCSNCPYVRKLVAEASAHCPAAQLIGLEKKA